MKNKRTAATSVPAPEAQVIEAVAQYYELSPEQTKLLYAIRKVENGGPGKEFGVLAPQAMRFAKDPVRSFQTQAEWAAGTIKKRFNGNLEEFAMRWAPIGADNDPKGLNKNWLKNTQYYMENL